MIIRTMSLLAAMLLGALPARAARQPDHLASRPALEVPAGAPAPRAFRSVAHIPPVAASAAARGGMLATATWQSIWDRDTNTPLRLYGSGIPVPGSVADPAVAAAAASRALADHIHLLAPGSQASDFELVSNHLHDGIRTIGFRQLHRGVPVLGGQVSFRFKADRLVAIGSEALPDVSVAAGEAPGGSAAGAATDWVDADFDTTSKVTEIGDPVILPIVSGRGTIDYHLATPVTVESAQPIGRWTVYVGSADKVVARRQMLHFAAGTVLSDIPERWPGGGRGPRPAASANLTVDGSAQTSSAEGEVTFDGSSASVGTAVSGPFVQVVDDSGNPASAVFTLFDGSSITWGEAADENRDAQLTTFISANESKVRARVLNPDLAWLDQQMTATVNIGQTCNAFSDGDSINFFVGSGQCGNTGTLVDVVHHEFGHSLHGQSIIPGVGAFDPAFSEGLSDYWAATIANDPAMGRGFFRSDGPLRHIDPPNAEAVWPRDVVADRPHTTGLIFGGAMWDLRQALVAEHGESAGVALANRLFYAAVQRASDIPSTYVEILVADDDDGNLLNGTPNMCTIQEVFAAHGLTDGAGLIGTGLDFPLRDGFEVTVPITQLVTQCAGSEVTGLELTWRLRDDAGAGGTVAMEPGDVAYTGAIPPQEEGVVVQYQVGVTLADGTRRSLPLNPAAPFYEFFTGATEPLYCTDFETDPRGEWSTGAVFGSDSWEWGAPVGASGDPGEAYSGSSIFGVALGRTYEPGIQIFAETPVIDTSGYDEVRLQYRRWLGVEDSFYDQAVIQVDGDEVWRNQGTNGQSTLLQHQDHEWRFHDVDLGAQAADGSVKVRFALASDEGAQFAGWNLDDVCVVAVVDSVCGDGEVTGIEECDDGNTEDGDGCTSECVAGEGSGGGCGCQSSGGAGSAGLLLILFGLFAWRRRNVRGHRHRVTV